MAKKEDEPGLRRHVWKIVVFVVAVVILGFVAYRMTFAYVPECPTFGCFQEAMLRCEPAKFTNDEAQATWRYEVLGKDDDRCVVNVRLLQAKEGELSLDKLAGYDMQCAYPRGVTAYPERDLSMCHGRLKEELQGLVIEKLHTYILENLGQIGEELARPF